MTLSPTGGEGGRVRTPVAAARRGAARADQRPPEWPNSPKPTTSAAQTVPPSPPQGEREEILGRPSLKPAVVPLARVADRSNGTAPRNQPPAPRKPFLPRPPSGGRGSEGEGGRPHSTTRSRQPPPFPKTTAGTRAAARTAPAAQALPLTHERLPVPSARLGPPEQAPCAPRTPGKRKPPSSSLGVVTWSADASVPTVAPASGAARSVRSCCLGAPPRRCGSGIRSRGRTSAASPHLLPPGLASILRRNHRSDVNVRS